MANIENTQNDNNKQNEEEKKMEFIPKKKDKACYVCGEQDHLKRDCPKNTDKDKQVKKGKGGRPNYAERFVKPLSEEEEQKLDKARIEELPEKLDYEMLHIYVDGYNIIGCDKICRNFMYKSKNTKNKARERLSKLIQELFIEKIKLNYGLCVHLWFDGHIDSKYTMNNKSIENYKDIEITHTPINYVVDDKLVDQFSKISIDKNGDKLVITADRELTIRLFDVGVMSMKSGKFYKQFLKEDDNEENQGK